MGTYENAPWPAGVWKRHLADAVVEPSELLEILGLAGCPPFETPGAARRFPLRVPRGFVARMGEGDPSDPLLLQVLPTENEDIPSQGFTTDPVGELANPPTNGLLRKYHGRALLLVTGACAVNCRYCFRRHFPYPDLGSKRGELEAAFSALAADPKITELILSGGDPLLASEERLAEITRGVSLLPQLQRLRIHTRLPIVLPQRVDGPLMSWIGGLGVPLVVVVHVNHANEIDDDVRRALAALTSKGVTLLNQTVLLRGVNDSVEAQVALGEALFDTGVLPYYLHMLDPVEGAAHFEVPEEEARQLYRDLKRRLPGYLVPRFVREVPGAPSKIDIFDSFER